MCGYCTLVPLRHSVWPLGGAKKNCLTLDIFVVFEPVASISTQCCSTPQALQIPPSSDGFPPPVWGLASHKKHFLPIAKKIFPRFFRQNLARSSVQIWGDARGPSVPPNLVQIYPVGLHSRSALKFFWQLRTSVKGFICSHQVTTNASALLLPLLLLHI